MNKSTSKILLAALAMGLVIAFLSRRNGAISREQQLPSAGGGINWLTELEPAIEKGKASGQPIMVDFFATWCGPCKMLDEQTYSDSRVIEASRGWIMVRIDVDENQALTRKYKINSIPTIVLLDPNGREVRRQTGFIGVGPMISLMKSQKAAFSERSSRVRNVCNLSLHYRR